jgi:DNA-binding NarL/FixJ family response regulator
MVVDEHDVVRAGLCLYLDSHPDIHVVAEASGAAQAMDQLLVSRSQIVIVDVSIPIENGLDAIQRLHMVYPSCQIIALTTSEDREILLRLLSAGAVGIVSKREQASELISAIVTIAQGGVHIPAKALHSLVDAYCQKTEARNMRAGENTDIHVLSTREKQVLQLVADGYTNPEIASQLGISPKTVAHHRERLMYKLGLHSCSDLVKYAYRAGLIKI